MIKTKKQMFIIIGVFTLVLLLGSVSYAWFSYRAETGSSEIVAGDIYLTMTEGNETLTLTNIFPETKEEARARNDNYITFELSGLNTSNKTIYYEILLNHGADKPSPKSRYADSDLRFDLVELDSNGDEVDYLLNGASFDTLINKRIWVDTIDANTQTEVSKKYKLRAWLSDDVIISDSEPNANYNTTEYPNKYATIKVKVNGDFQEKYFGYQKVKKAILAKQNATTNSCNPTWTDEEDGIIYFSGTDNCVDMNYVWYSGKLWRITAIYPDGAMKLVTQNNITSIAFNASGQVNFYTDTNTTSYMYQWLNEDFYDTLYHANEFIDISKQWNATMQSNAIVQPEEINMVTANVGLLNNYDYYNSYRCIGSDNCTGSNYSTGYLNTKYYWWLLNPRGENPESTVWYVGDYAGHRFGNPSGTNAVRPSIVIKSGIEFIGNGSKSDPYKIVGDKEIGTSNELINTRLSGEYVKIANGSTYKLFRIIGVEDNKIKIIDRDYADSGNTRKFATSNGNTLWGSGTTTGTNTWYTYLNNTYYSRLVSTYGNMFDSGIYYLGTSNGNYKLSVCANTTSESIKECDKTNEKEIFNIGISRYGEMFATKQYYDSTPMWLISPSSMGRVWYVTQYGSGAGNLPTSTASVRPTVHLKSTVKIISGTGTETDPYVVGL